jgi:hypothetical protein
MVANIETSKLNRTGCVYLSQNQNGSFYIFNSHKLTTDLLFELKHSDGYPWVLRIIEKFAAGRK